MNDEEPAIGGNEMGDIEFDDELTENDSNENGNESDLHIIPKINISAINREKSDVSMVENNGIDQIVKKLVKRINNGYDGYKFIHNDILEQFLKSC